MSMESIDQPARSLAPEIGSSASLTVRLGSFASQAVLDESRRMGISGEELATFSVLYYLADLQSGRTARRPRQAWLSAAA